VLNSRAVNDFNSSNNASVEFGQLLRGNPVFAMYARTHCQDFKMREVFIKDMEVKDEFLSASRAFQSSLPGVWSPTRTSVKHLTIRSERFTASRFGLMRRRASLRQMRGPMQ